jgi:RNA polymerase sigma-70 factor (ECF subfamily)
MERFAASMAILLRSDAAQLREMTIFQPDDGVLMSRMCRGDANAAQVLYDRHGAALLRFALAMTRNRETAEDVLHDVFVELLRRPNRFDPGFGSLQSYLYGMVRNRVMRILRSGHRHEENYDAVGTDSLDGDALVLQPTAEDGAARMQAIEHVRAAVLALPVLAREVIALCDLSELPYDTVAAILDCPIGTVRSRLHRARTSLAARLAVVYDAGEKAILSPAAVDADLKGAPP